MLGVFVQKKVKSKFDWSIYMSIYMILSPCTAMARQYILLGFASGSALFLSCALPPCVFCCYDFHVLVFLLLQWQGFLFLSPYNNQWILA